MADLRDAAERVGQLAARAQTMAPNDPGAEELLIKAANILAAAGLCQKTRDVKVVRG